MALEIIAIEHVECETIGSIRDTLGEKRITVRTIQPFKGDAIPSDLGPARGLIVMGGPMGVYDHDKFPFLRDEMRLIQSAVQREIPLLGICLGSQLLAAAAGAAVRPSGQYEIGWHSVSLTDTAKSDPLLQGIPHSFMALHWHGDVFELPASAELLASSLMTAHQAFRLGKCAYGFLFHMEVTAEGLERMAATFPEDVERVGLTAAKLSEQSQQFLPALRPIANEVFGRWADLVAAASGNR